MPISADSSSNSKIATSLPTQPEKIKPKQAPLKRKTHDPENKWIIGSVIGGGLLSGFAFMLFNSSSKDENSGTVLSKTVSPKNN